MSQQAFPFMGNQMPQQQFMMGSQFGVQPQFNQAQMPFAQMQQPVFTQPSQPVFNQPFGATVAQPVF
jgi:hypothetical protein